MQSAFKQTRGIGPEQEVLLMFDGDRLDVNSRISDTEIGDMDYIDVHIK